MNDDEEKNIDKEQEDKEQTKQPEDENQAPEVKTPVEAKKEVIHKKNGRLHIYVRQDKYKGELKSHNWVGRLYIDGKQKISSSGTPNLEEAIPILEKWFEDIHTNKGKEEQPPQETSETTSEQPSVIETPQQPETPVAEKTPQSAVVQSVTAPVENTEPVAEKTTSSIFDKLKKIKLKKPSFDSGD